MAHFYSHLVYKQSLRCSKSSQGYKLSTRVHISDPISAVCCYGISAACCYGIGILRCLGNFQFFLFNPCHQMVTGLAMTETCALRHSQECTGGQQSRPTQLCCQAHSNCATTSVIALTTTAI